MTDLTALSDDDLRALYAPDLTKMSDQDLQAAYAAHAAAKPNTSMLDAPAQGLSSLVGGVGKTVKEYISDDAGKFIMGKAANAAPKNYKSGYESFANPSDGADKHFMGLDWSSAPRALLEQAPALAEDLLVNRALKRLGPVGQLVGNSINFTARSAGNEAQKRADARSGVEGTTPDLADKATGLGSAVSQAALNSLSTAKLGSVNATKGFGPAVRNAVAAAVTEGGTNAAQDLISQGAATAGTDANVNLKDTLAQGVLGGLGGAAFASAPVAKAGILEGRFRQPADEHATMAANRITESGSADKAKQDIATEIKRAADDVTNPSTAVDNALVRAKSGTPLSEKDLTAIDSVGDDNLSSLVRQSAALSNVSDQAGGLSGKLERFVKSHPIWALGGVASPHLLAAAGLPGLAASLPAAGGLIAGGGLAYGGLRALDSALGLRNPSATFAERYGDTSGKVRPDAPPSAMTAAGVSVPQVTPQNSLTTPQPWGPVQDKPTPFRPDMLDSNLQKIVDKLQNQKRRDTSQEALPLLRQLAAQNQPTPEAPGLDVAGLNEQIKGAMLMASARRKIAGQQQAEAEAADSPMINEQGGLEALSNPAMGKRAQELISAANAMARLRRQPEETEAPPIAPEAPPQPTAPQAPQPPSRPMEEALMAPQPEAPSPPKPKRLPLGVYMDGDGWSVVNEDTRERVATGFSSSDKAHEARRKMWTENSEPQSFVLPESPHVFKDPQTAARDIHAEAVAGGKEIRNAAGYKAGTQRRLAGEEAIYETISKSLNSVKERGDFHKYLSALWGSDSPEVVTKVREHMLAEFPQHADTISKHLSDEAIKGLWTKAKKQK